MTEAEASGPAVSGAWAAGRVAGRAGGRVLFGQALLIEAKEPIESGQAEGQIEAVLLAAIGAEGQFGAMVLARVVG